MRRIHTKLMAVLAAALLIINLLPAGAQAASVSSTQLTQAIQKVKQNFVIPGGCTEFSSNYSETDGRKLLFLTWSSPNNSNKGYFNAQIDVTNGEIVGMNQWKPVPPGQAAQVPNYSIAAARDLGNKMLARLVPSRVKSLRSIDNSQLMSLSGYSSPSCSLRWQRYADNIPVSGDIASMEVDLVTGQINSFNLNWTALELPKATGAVTADQAWTAFKDAGMLELEYQVPMDYKPLMTGEKDKAPYLIYQVSHPSSGMIDAVTGKPLVLESGHYVTDIGGYGGMGGLEQAMSKKLDSSALTPQEQSEVDTTAKMISQQEAEDVVKKLVMSQFDDKFTLRYTNLEKDWRNPTQKSWSLSWVGAASSSGEQGPSLYARVNALNGDLLSFNYDPMRYTSSQDKITREDAQKLAEAYIKQVAPSRADAIRPNPIPNTYRYPNTPHYFSYQRMVGDIVCPANGINITVDPVSGKIISYNLDWSELPFPDATTVMGNDKAYERFSKLAPLGLTYVPEWGPQGLLAVRLVYRPAVQPDFPNVVIIDAISGTQLDSQGKPVAAPPHALTFSDIKGAYGEKEISILGQAGLMGEYNSAFKPGAAVQLVTLLRAMQGCRNGIYAVNGQSDEEIMKQAHDSGLLKENLAGTTVVSRELFCRLLTRYLGVEYLAQVSGIYKTTYRDVPAALNGYTAVVSGLGLIEVKGTKFEPTKPITRAQVAVALIHALPRLNSK